MEEHGVTEAAAAADTASADVAKTLPEPRVAPAPGMFAVGQKVVQKVFVPVWTIKGFHLSEDQKTLQYLASWTDEAGQEHEHYFTHDQIEEAR